MVLLQTRFLRCIILFLLSFPSCHYTRTCHASPPPHGGDHHHHHRRHLGEASSGTFVGDESVARTQVLDNWPWRRFGSYKVGGSSTRSLASVKTINVNDYRAKGDASSSDATEAFKKAWEVACSSYQGSVAIVVPKNSNYFLKPITFQGPCKSSITVQIYGGIQAYADRSVYRNDNTRWLVFENVENLEVEGGGLINGNGKTWWQHSCKVNDQLPCKDAPTALTFYNCNKLAVKNLKIKNAQQMHVSFEKCVGVQASGLTITAPANSPNTDGIHVAATQNIHISNSVIGTGDDCISIVSGSHKVQVTGVTCGPGHGISIGSLGSEDSESNVSNVTVTSSTLTRTMNGVRIKTWQGGSGIAKNIQFQDITMHNVENPIIIDQAYCDRAKPCKSQRRSAVQVENVLYKNIKGTSSSEEGVIFNCSEELPCKGIVLQDINIKVGGGKKVAAATAVCNNALVTQKGDVSPNC